MTDRLAPDVLALDARLGPLAEATARLERLPLEGLLTYLVDTVPASYLPELARQFHIMGLEGWRFAATDEQRRRLIREAIALHRKKGTPAALRGIVRAATGWEMTIEEWWQYGAPPFTWRGVIWATSATPGRPLTPGLLQQLQQMLQEWRPVSRHGSLRLGARFAARPLMSCAALRVTGAARRSLTVRSPALRPESAAAACTALRVSAVVHFRITL